MWRYSFPVHADWVCVSLVISLPVLSLLPTAHPPGWRWDALSSTAESGLCAERGCCIQNEAPPSRTLRFLASTKERKTNGISVVIRSPPLCRLFRNCYSSSFSEGSGQSRKRALQTLSRRLQTGVFILELRSEVHSRLQTSPSTMRAAM